MRKPKNAKGMSLVSMTKRIPKKLIKCLKSQGPSSMVSSRGKWTTAYNHDTGKFEVWAKPGTGRKCGLASRA
jgi:hypothetical protein